MVNFYGAVPQTTYTITGLSNNPGFDASVFMSKWLSTKKPLTSEPLQLVVTTVGYVKGVTIRDAASRDLIVDSYSDPYTDQMAAWGFASEPVAGDFTSTIGTESLSKPIKKLYGSVNGQTKLIKKLYGSVNGATKLVYEA